MLRILLALVLFSSCASAQTVYIVRHAEKDANTMSSDVPLSEAGKQRAEALRQLLKDSSVTAVYSTNFIRTKTTAQPLAEALGLTVQTYDPRDTGFVQLITATGKGNVLIVGHSNTVDDLVNGFLGQKWLSDLPESSYGNLFIIRMKGKKTEFFEGRFGN